MKTMMKTKQKLTMSKVLRILPPSSIIPHIHIEKLSEEVDSRFWADIDWFHEWEHECC